MAEPPGSQTSFFGTIAMAMIDPRSPRASSAGARRIVKTEGRAGESPMYQMTPFREP